MSQKLYCRILTPHNESLPNQIRDIFREQYQLPIRLSQIEYAYLLGLRDAKVEGAKELLELKEGGEDYELYIGC